MKKRLSHYAELLEQRPVYNPEHEDPGLCFMLWCTTITQASADYHSKDIKLKQEVTEWLRSRDFNTVCSLVDLAPQQARKFITSDSVLHYGVNLLTREQKNPRKRRVHA